MITSLQLRAMRHHLLLKAASRAVGSRREYEEMSSPRLKQWMKDLPVVALGTGLGYAGGAALGNLAARHAPMAHPRVHRALRTGLPMAAAITSSLGSYALGQQSALQKQRRDEAEALEAVNRSVKQAFYAGTGSPVLAATIQRNHPVFARLSGRRPIPDREKVWNDDMEDVALREGDDE